MQTSKVGEVGEEILAAVLRSTEYVSGYKGDEPTISASQLGSDLLQLFLKEVHGNQEEKKFTDATLGTLVHQAMELLDFGGLDVKKEFAFDHKEPDIYHTMTGTADLVCKTEDGGMVIIDYKTGKNYGRKKFLEERHTHGYTKQLSLLKYMAHKKWGIPLDKIHTGILWVLKDSKAIKDEPVLITDEVPYLQNIKEEFSLKSKELKKAMDKHEQNQKYSPSECEDVWYRKVDGKTVKTRCKLYCSYSEVCPKFKETLNDKLGIKLR